MAIQSSNKGQIFNEINITPLTDIFLVLLIIMMVIAPMFQTVDKNIAMPKINSGVTVEEKEVTIAITKNAEYFLNGEPVKSGELQSKLTSMVNIAKNKNVVVKADTMTKNKEIMNVIRAAQFAGFEKLTVAGEPLSSQQQSELKNNTLQTEE